MVPDPSRCAVLAALAGLAGCTGAPSPTPTEPSPSPTPPRTPNATVTTTRGATDPPDSTATADPPGESRFADRPCPPMLDSCYHRATAETPVFVRPSAERVDLGETVELSLVNRIDGSVFFGPYYWTVWREDGDGWTNVDSRDAVEDLGAEIEPGETYTWTVPVDTEGDRTYGSHRAAVGVEFEPGVYCFGVRDVPLSGDEDAERGAPGALFEVV